jgi:diguanylate cyclase (GGDEF)-like protein
MSLHEKTLGPLLDLGNLATRRTRAEQFEHALRTALLLTEADAAVLLSPSARRGERFVLHAGSAAPALMPSQTSGSEVARLFAEEPQILALPHLADQARFVAGDNCPGVEAGPVLYAPLRQRDPALGYIAVYRRFGRARFGLAESSAMLFLSAWLGIALENLRLASGVEKVAVTDGLTEVYNARFLKAALHRELRRASRFGQELSLVLVELDQLEAFQAEHGELRANAILRELASLLARQVRSFDLVARADGDGFMLVLPQTGKAGAKEVAERMRAAVEGNEFSAGPAGTITASFGVASFPRQGGDYKGLVASVERALGEARQRGPNCVYALDRAA